jgi:hypothetical protein
MRLKWLGINHLFGVLGDFVLRSFGGLPQNVSVDSNNVYTIVGQRSVYQARSTRNRSEVMSADSY